MASSIAAATSPRSMSPAPFQTFAYGINASGQIVGTFANAFPAPSDGFLYSGGSFTTIAVPGAISTGASGINNSGEIVGGYTDSTGTHGFLATPTGVPEPSTLPLVAGCLIGLAMA